MENVVVIAIFASNVCMILLVGLIGKFILEKIRDLTTRMDRAEEAIVSSVMEEDQSLLEQALRNERVMKTYKELLGRGQLPGSAMIEARNLWAK